MRRRRSGVDVARVCRRRRTRLPRPGPRALSPAFGRIRWLGEPLVRMLSGRANLRSEVSFSPQTLRRTLVHDVNIPPVPSSGAPQLPTNKGVANHLELSAAIRQLVSSSFWSVS